MPRLTPRIWLVASTHLLLAVLMLFGIWVTLPARWLPVDVIGSALAAFGLVSVVGLVLGKRWGSALARVTSWALLSAGCVTVSALALTVAHLSGLYGPVGAGGGLLMGTMAALVLPYLVGIPVLQLVWLRPTADSA